MADGDNSKGDIELQEKDSEIRDTGGKVQQRIDRPSTRQEKVQARPSGVSKKPATADHPPDPPKRDYATEDTEVAKSSGVSIKPTNRPDPPTKDYATEGNKDIDQVIEDQVIEDQVKFRRDEAKPSGVSKNSATGTEGAVYASVNKRKTLGSFLPPRPEFVYRPDDIEAWMSCLRIGHIVLNILIWGLGAALTALGIWIRVDKDFWTIQTNLDMTQFENASYILIAAGVVIMIVGFIGCYGAIMSQICLLIVFSIIVAIIIVLEIAVVAIVFSVTASKENQEKVKLKAITALHEMMDNDKKAYFINMIQSKLECCGVNGPQDYTDSVKPKEIPRSCYDDSIKLWTKGCYDAILDYFKGKAALCGGIAVVVFLLQLAALIFTGCLICSIRSSSNGIF